MSYRLKRYLAGTVILAVALLVTFSLMSSKKPPERKPRVASAPIVEVIDLAPETHQFLVASQGTVQPLTETSLSAEVAGTVVTMSDNFVPGGTFVAGEVLMQIDPVNYRVAVERAEAAVRQRQIEYDGAKKLREQGYRAEAELASAEAALASAKADLTRAQRDLDRTLVRLPYGGLVRTRAAQLGDYVAPGTPLGTVFATDVVEVRLPLPDTELPFVELPRVGSAGDLPMVTLQGSYRGRPQTWTGRIVRTEGTVDERNRMVFAVARVDDPYKLDSADETPLPVGTFVTADIAGIVMDDIVRIPRALVRGGDQVIFVNDESELAFATLDFLRTDDEYAYVRADQLEHLRVVATRLEAPLAGMKVRTGADVPAPDDEILGGESEAATASEGTAEGDAGGSGT